MPFAIILLCDRVETNSIKPVSQGKVTGQKPCIHAGLRRFDGHSPTIKADKIIAYLNYRNEFEVLQYRNIKDVQEITPLRGYSSLYNAFLKSQSTPGSDSDAGDRYFNEWYQAQGK